LSGTAFLSEKRGWVRTKPLEFGRIWIEFGQKVIEFALFLKAFCHRGTESTENGRTLLNGGRNCHHGENTDSERGWFGDETIESMKYLGCGTPHTAARQLLEVNDY